MKSYYRMLRKIFLPELLFLFLLICFVLPGIWSMPTTNLSQKCSWFVNSTTYDTKSCARFYACSKTNHTWILKQCKFPLLYSTETQLCQDPIQNEVDCRNRTEPLSPCDYNMSAFFTAADGQCLRKTKYSDLDYRICISKKDGKYPYPDRPWSPFYVMCIKQRTFPKRCHNGADIIYDPINKGCFLVYSVVAEFSLLKSFVKYNVLLTLLNFQLQTSFNLLHTQPISSMSHSPSPLTLISAIAITSIPEQSVSSSLSVSNLNGKSLLATQQSTIGHNLNSIFYTSSESDHRAYIKETNTKINQQNNIVASNALLESVFDPFLSQSINFQHEEMLIVGTEKSYHYKTSTQSHYKHAESCTDSELQSLFSLITSHHPVVNRQIPTYLKTAPSEASFQTSSTSSMEATHIKTASKSFQKCRASLVDGTHIKTTSIASSGQTRASPMEATHIKTTSIASSGQTRASPMEATHIKTTSIESSRHTRPSPMEATHIKTTSIASSGQTRVSPMETTHIKTTSIASSGQIRVSPMETTHIKTASIESSGHTRASPMEATHIKTTSIESSRHTRPSPMEATHIKTTSIESSRHTRASPMEATHIKTTSIASSGQITASPMEATRIKTTSIESSLQTRRASPMEATQIKMAASKSFQNSRASSVEAKHIKTIPTESSFQTNKASLVEATHIKTTPTVGGLNKETKLITLIGINELIKPSPVLGSTSMYVSNAVQPGKKSSVHNETSIVFITSCSIGVAVCVTAVAIFIIMKIRVSKHRNCPDEKIT